MIRFHSDNHEIILNFFTFFRKIDVGKTEVEDGDELLELITPPRKVKMISWKT